MYAGSKSEFSTGSIVIMIPENLTIETGLNILRSVSMFTAEIL